MLGLGIKSRSIPKSREDVSCFLGGTTGTEQVNHQHITGNHKEGAKHSMDEYLRLKPHERGKPHRYPDIKRTPTRTLSIYPFLPWV
jgi:hypothetical protein